MRVTEGVKFLWSVCVCANYLLSAVWSTWTEIFGGIWEHLWESIVQIWRRFIDVWTADVLTATLSIIVKCTHLGGNWRQTALIFWTKAVISSKELDGHLPFTSEWVCWATFIHLAFPGLGKIVSAKLPYFKSTVLSVSIYVCLWVQYLYH